MTTGCIHTSSGPTVTWTWVISLLPDSSVPALSEEAWWSCFGSLSIRVNLDPVYNSPWKVQLFLFPQCMVSKVNSCRSSREGLGESQYTCPIVASSFHMCLDLFFSWWFLSLKSQSVFKTRQELVTFHWDSWPQPTVLLLIYSRNLLVIYIKQYSHWLIYIFPRNSHSLLSIITDPSGWYPKLSSHYGNYVYLALKFKSCQPVSAIIGS